MNIHMISLMKTNISVHATNKTFLINDDFLKEQVQSSDKPTLSYAVMLGFAEDHEKIVVNEKREFILKRLNTDINTYVVKKDASTVVLT